MTLLLPLDKTPQQMVAEFMAAFETSNDIRLWSRLIEEELRELTEAMNIVVNSHVQTPEMFADALKEGCDLFYVLVGYQVVTEGTIVDLKGETLANIKHLLTTITNVFGEGFSVAFARVHRSNMSKLGADGKPVRREDGKILKGPNYRAPDLLDIVKATFGDEA